MADLAYLTDLSYIDAKMRLLTIATNATVQARCMEQPMMYWQVIAEKVVEDILMDEWEWLIMPIAGKPPEVVILRYNP